MDGDRRIKRLRLFQHVSGGDQELQLAEVDAAAGKTKLIATVDLGDELNGHPGLIHGGFAAALLDDLFGWTAFLEAEQHVDMKNSTIFTANLNVNYRRPMKDKSAYTIELYAEKVVRKKKIYLKALIQNSEGELCVDGT